MPEQKPSIGRIVHYRLTWDDVKKTNARREDAVNGLEAMRRDRPGFQAHIGNSVSHGDVVSLVITRTLPDGEVNGQALLDGTDSLWVTSVGQGDGAGQWSWPPRV